MSGEGRESDFQSCYHMLFQVSSFHQQKSVLKECAKYGLGSYHLYP